jgi:hypothetical protein
MELQNQAHERCYAMVASYLKQSFGDLAEPSENDPSFYVALGRVGMYVTANSMGDDDASVSVYAWLARGLTITPEVASRMLELNAEYRFGALAVDSDGDIIYEHVLPAEGLTKGALATVVRLVSSGANEIDNELRMRFA